MKIIYTNVDELEPYEKNAKKHPESQIENIAKSITEFGFNIPILADKENCIIAGHGRLLAAKRIGLEKVPVIFSDKMSPAQIKAYRIADNKLAESGWDKKLLHSELSELTELDFDIEMLGFTVDEINKLLPDYTLTDGLTDPNNIPEVDDSLPEIKPGQIVSLGSHRLLCGNNQDHDLITQLMDGKLADMVFTDPPYGVNYSSKTAFYKKIGKMTKNLRPIKNDDLKAEEIYKQIWLPSFKRIYEALAKSGAYYFTAPSGSDLLLYFLKALKENKLAARHMLIWVKNSLVLGRSDYNYKHEPILMGWKDFEYESTPIIYGWKEEGHKFYGTANEVSVWNIARPQRSELHPTMKPVELIVRAIHNSTLGGGIVSDFFGGSGSTLIACEQTGRICYMVELEPFYCSIIIKRWEEFTGRKAEKN